MAMGEIGKRLIIQGERQSLCWLKSRTLVLIRVSSSGEHTSEFDDFFFAQALHRSIVRASIFLISACAYLGTGRHLWCAY